MKRQLDMKGVTYKYQAATSRRAHRVFPHHLLREGELAPLQKLGLSNAFPSRGIQRAGEILFSQSFVFFEGIERRQLIIRCPTPVMQAYGIPSQELAMYKGEKEGADKLGGEPRV
jgi:hypothetical protein